MDIDLAALRALERERDISLDILIPAIEQALLLAYQRTEGHERHARVELDRTSGHVVVWARQEIELPPEPEPVDTTALADGTERDGALTTRMGGFQWLALVGSAAIMTLGAVSMLGVDDAAGRAAATLVAEKPAVADPVAVATAHVD